MQKFLIILLWIISLVVAFIAGDYFELGRSIPEVTEYGRFLSNPKVTLVGDGRNITLLEDFVYIDPDERPWLAPKGRTVNGASIPQIFWSATGGPLSGKFRNASIVHDVECKDMKHDHDKVHLMFYHACLAGGVPRSKAKKLYWAVARFGPKWTFRMHQRTVQYENANGEAVAYPQTISEPMLFETEAPTEEDVKWAEEYFSQNDPPVQLIPNLDRGKPLPSAGSTLGN